MVTAAPPWTGSSDRVITRTNTPYTAAIALVKNEDGTREDAIILMIPLQVEIVSVGANRDETLQRALECLADKYVPVSVADIAIGYPMEDNDE